MRERTVTALVLGANVVAALHVGKVPTALPAIAPELGLSLVQAGWVLSLTNLIAATTAFAVPALATVVGARRLAPAAMGCLVLGSIGGSVSADAGTLLASRVVEGAGLLLIMIAGPALLAQVLDRRRLRLLLAVWPACMPVGIALMLVLTPALLEVVGWRGTWLLTGLVAGCTGAALVVATRGVPTHSGGVGLSRASRMLAEPVRRLAVGPIRWLAAVALCYSAQFLGVLGLLPAVLGRRAEFGTATVTALTAAAFLANGVGTTIAAALQARGVPGTRLILPAAIVMAPALWLVYDPGRPLAATMIAAWAFAGAGGCVASGVMVGVAAHADSPGQVAAGVAAVIWSINLGQLIGPPVVAAAASGGSWAATPGWLMVPAGVVLVGGVRLWSTRP